MTLHFHTAHASYFGPDRVDITRSGCDALLRDRRDTDDPVAPGVIFAPSRELVFPVVMHVLPALRALVDAGWEAGAPDPRTTIAGVWAAYKSWYTAEMRVSYGAKRRSEYGLLERLAEKRGVRPAHDRWLWWLAQETATFVCMCTYRIGGELVCHRAVLAPILVSLGAVYEGEVQKGAEK